MSVWVRSDWRPSIVGEATDEVLEPGSSSSDLALTRLTSLVIFNDNPSSMGVVTLGASPFPICGNDRVFLWRGVVGRVTGGW